MEKLHFTLNLELSILVLMISSPLISIRIIVEYKLDKIIN